MRKKIYATFESLDDAKIALGSIKKDNLNQADLKVVFLPDEKVNVDPHKTQYEVGEELFQNPLTNPHFEWPGVKGLEIINLGKVQVASNTPLYGELEPDPDLSVEDLEIVEPEVKARKVVTIVEAEADLIPKLKFILQQNGAEII